MTAFAEVIRPLEQGQLRLTLRSVNHKALELSVRMPPALYPLENAIRAAVRGAAQRGKLDLAIDVQDEPGLEPRLNRALLRNVAKAWKEDAEWLELPPLSAEAFFRFPGAWVPPASDLAERLEVAVMEALGELLEAWNEGRRQEAERLVPFFWASLDHLQELRAVLQAEAEVQAAELPGQYLQRLEQTLRDAQLAGQLPAERVVAEAGVLAERQDVREELVRLSAHLDDLEERLRRTALGGKALDVWSQEVLRELRVCFKIPASRDGVQPRDPARKGPQAVSGHTDKGPDNAGRVAGHRPAGLGRQASLGCVKRLVHSPAMACGAFLATLAWRSQRGPREF